MIALLLLFLNNLLPLLIVLTFGIIIHRTLKVDAKPLSQTVFNVFTPALVFDLLVNAEVPVSELARMALYTILLALSVICVSWLIGRTLKLEGSALAAFLLVLTFGNNGNFGMSLIHFALGKEALAFASIFFVASVMILNTIGVYIATVGQSSPRDALRGLLRIPTVYVIPVAILIHATGLNIPLAIWRPIELLSGAAIPSMLIILGIQIAKTGIPQRTKMLGYALFGRLILVPALGFILARSVGLQDAAFQAGILEAAMPVAVMTSILAIEFDVKPDFVSGAILASTLISPFTLTPLLALLGA